jgi:CPA2 family monovalent cation:H+ antiporter-2
MAGTVELSLFLSDALVILGAAGLVIPVFAKARITPVTGFILVGLLVGPYGLGRYVGTFPPLRYVTISNPHGLEPFAEFGIVLLLFSIGLELSASRLWAVRRMVFELGLLKLLISAALLSGASLVFGGQPVTGAIAIGVALAMSSTALVLKITGAASPVGRVALTMLLFEDFALMPVIFLLGAMAPHASASTPGLARTLALGALAIAALLVIGRFILPRLFARAARTKSPELFLAAILLSVILSALATGAAGLSPIVGALIAGLLVAETEYHGEVGEIVAPFQGLGLGVFLITVGMSIDLATVWRDLGPLLAATAGVLLLKALVTSLVLRTLGARSATAAETGLLMASPSETTLIVLTAAVSAGLVGHETAQFWKTVTAIGLSVTPLLALAGRTLGRRVDGGSAARMEEPEKRDVPAGSRPRAIIVGFGRTGRIVGEMLAAHGQRYLAVDSDADVVRDARRDGCAVIFGNASRGDLLEKLCAVEASAVILTMDEPVSAQRLARKLRAEYPDLPIIARAHDATDAAALYRAGASHAVPEQLESSLQLSEATLVELGVAMGPVIASIHAKRDALRDLIVAEGELGFRPKLRATTAYESEQ